MIDLEGLEDIDDNVITAINRGLTSKDKNIHSPAYTCRTPKMGGMRKTFLRLKRRLKNWFLQRNSTQETYPFY